MPNPMAPCQKLVSDGIAALIGHSDSPEIDAELLLSHALGQTRSWLLAYQDEPVEEADIKKYQSLLERRIAGEPIAYIFGEREFWSLNLKINSHVLIPRPDTEVLVEHALELCTKINPQNDQSLLSLVDLGTGSGAIAIALAVELDLLQEKNSNVTYQVSAVDQSSDALELAKQNSTRNNAKGIIFHQGNWFSPLLNEKFNLIVSNPPYIAENDPHLFMGDVRFEPRSALTSGIDGLKDISYLISNAPEYLAENGYLALEHGYDQAKKVQGLLKAKGFAEITTVEDYGGNQRVTSGKWSTKATDIPETGT